MEADKLKVLVIEHDAEFARAVGGMLSAAPEVVGGVVLAGTRDEALARLQETSFGIVLLEAELPDGTGLLNIPVLRERAPHLPIIVLGAADDEALALEAVHAGAQDYLVKSQLNPRWLLRSIRYTLERHAAEMAVISAEENYHSIFDHLVEGIFRTTPDGAYLMANATLARIYGYNSPEELMRSMTDIGRRLYVAPGRREEFKRVMEERDTITDFESEIYRKDGTTIWISENCRAVRDATGKLLYYEGTVEDITQRRQAEENVRHSEALYHSLVETMPQCIFRKDTRGRYTFANPEFCRTLGKPLDEILGHTIYDFMPADQAEQREQDDREVLLGGKPIERIELSRFHGSEHRFIQVIKLPIFDANGRVVGLQGMFWDITEMKLAEERIRRANEDLARSQVELRDSEALYHSLVETIPQNLFRKDRNERFTFANGQFCKTLGKSLAEIVGRTDYDFFPRELAAKYQADDAQVIATGRSLEAVEEHKLPSGETIYVQVVKSPLVDAQGQIIGVQGMFWDITVQKLADERIRQANADLARSQEELRVKNLLMEDNLKMAREIQLTMLPQQYPVFPRGAAPEASAFQFTHRYLPAGTVGGDFFSVSALSDTTAAVFVCDVAGHGVRSALVTAMIRALVEELRPLAHEPGGFMTKLNSDLFAILKHTGTPVLTTAFYLVADATTGTMRYANAGHPKPLHLKRCAGEVAPLVNAGKRSQPALGLFEISPYETSSTELAPGDLVMIFTDGLYEVHADDQNLYTQAMLSSAAQRRLQMPAAALFDALLEEIRAYSAGREFDDDVCLVGLDYSKPA